jgi:ATP-binding cassette subfamily F protein 3
MEKLANEINGIDRQLSDNSIYDEANKHKLQQLLLSKADKEKTHEAAELEWLETNEELEQLLSVI